MTAKSAVLMVKVLGPLAGDQIKNCKATSKHTDNVYLDTRTRNIVY